MLREVFLYGSLLILTGVILGAFGAHAIEGIAKSKSTVDAFETGVRYQIYHGLAFLILCFQADKFSFSLTKWSRFLLVGLLLFSVSIYGIVLIKLFSTSASPVALALLTPLGGTLIIIAWIYLIIKVFRQKYQTT